MKLKMTSPRRLCVIITCTDKSSQETLSQTCEAFIQEKRQHDMFIADIYIWCTQCGPSFVQFAHQLSDANTGVHSVASNTSFLSDLGSTLPTTLHNNPAELILLVSCGVILRKNWFSFVMDKIDEYEDAAVLTAFGIRLFPHEKLNNVALEMKEGIHWKLYDSSQADRAVHFFTSEFCCIRVKVISQVAAYQDRFKDLFQLGSLMCSYIIGHDLDQAVWKIRASEFIDFSNVSSPTFFPCAQSDQKSAQCHKLYSYIYECDWPRYISVPLKCTTKHRNELPCNIWESGFGGINMSSKPASDTDFEAIAAYGAKVIRIGAVCDGNDLAYLLNPLALSCEEDREHFLRVVPQLKTAVLKASQYGLKVIITMTDLPGSKFHSHTNSFGKFPFWESPVNRLRAVKFWGLMAQSMADVSDNILGYDLINEPFTPDDMEINFFGDISMSCKDILNTFYLNALEEIRKYDKTVTVIVKSTCFASPRAINILQPLPDPQVTYAFHMYVPPYLTLYRKFGTQYSYPGRVPYWRQYPLETVEISKPSLLKLLETTVLKWQEKHSVSSNRILVAEFGICREVNGAQQYLKDAVEIFELYKWSWLLFSFRDEEWDALDYELGPDMKNMLDRSTSQLFMTVAEHFH